MPPFSSPASISYFRSVSYFGSISYFGCWRPVRWGWVGMLAVALGFWVVPMGAQVAAPVERDTLQPILLGTAEVQGTTVADARVAKPLDTGLIAQLAQHHAALITVEQGAQGGFGAMVLHHMAGAGLLDRGPAVRTITLPDRFIDHGTPAEMYAMAGMTAQDIADTALRALGVATLGRLRA